MKYEISSTKLQTNFKFEILNKPVVANSDFVFDYCDFKRLKGVQ